MSFLVPFPHHAVELKVGVESYWSISAVEGEGDVRHVSPAPLLGRGVLLPISRSERGTWRKKPSSDNFWYKQYLYISNAKEYSSLIKIVSVLVMFQSIDEQLLLKQTYKKFVKIILQNTQYSLSGSAPPPHVNQQCGKLPVKIVQIHNISKFNFVAAQKPAWNL